MNIREAIPLIIPSTAFLTVSYIIVKMVFSFIFRGFAPLASSRPWVVDQVLNEIKSLNLKATPVVISLGSGRSGMISAIQKIYPQGSFTGVELDWWSYFTSRLQIFLQNKKINVLKKQLDRVDVSKADLIYCYLDVLTLRGLERKFKFECHPGAIIVSNGFVIPNLRPLKEAKIVKRKERFSFLPKGGAIWSPKSKKSKKEDKLFFYVI